MPRVVSSPTSRPSSCPRSPRRPRPKRPQLLTRQKPTGPFQGHHSYQARDKNNQIIRLFPAITYQPVVRFFHFRCVQWDNKRHKLAVYFLVQRTFLQSPFHIVNGRPTVWIWPRLIYLNTEHFPCSKWPAIPLTPTAFPLPTVWVLFT